MAKSVAYHAKKLGRRKMQSLEKKARKNYIFKLAKKIKHENQNVISENCSWNDKGKLVTTE